MVQWQQNHWKTIESNGAPEKNHYHPIVLKKWPSLKSTYIPVSPCHSLWIFCKYSFGSIVWTTATCVHCSISLWPPARQTSMVHIRYALHCRLQLHTIVSLLISIYFNFEIIRFLSTSQTDCSLHNLQCTLYNIKRRKPMKAMQTRRWEESEAFSNFLFVRHRLECLPTHQKRCLTIWPTLSHFRKLCYWYEVLSSSSDPLFLSLSRRFSGNQFTIFSI